MGSVSPRELKDLLADETDMLIIDIREPWEFEDFNIGGINIPMTSIPLKLDELEPHKDRFIVICCSFGDRSLTAREFLESQGFSNVNNLTGGLLLWKQLKQP